MVLGRRLFYRGGFLEGPFLTESVSFVIVFLGMRGLFAITVEKTRRAAQNYGAGEGGVLFGVSYAIESRTCFFFFFFFYSN